MGDLMTMTHSGPSSSLIAQATAWMKDGACREQFPNMFFHEEEQGHPSVNEARRICDGCPVREPCLAYALNIPLSIDEETGEFAWVSGIWAGTTRTQRKRMREGAV